MGPILGIHQTMGIYGHLEGFLLNRGLFWASNILTPVFGGSIDIFSEVFGGCR